MRVETYAALRAELMAKREAQPVPLPPVKKESKPMAPAREAELKALYEQFKQAEDRDDAGAMVAIYNNPAYHKLMLEWAYASVGGSKWSLRLALAYMSANTELEQNLMGILGVRMRHLEKEVRRLGDQTKELKHLHASVKALEEKPSLKYAGTWSSDVQNNPGDIVTDHGSAWHCNVSTRERPGASSDWTLMIKKGRDAR
jgi:hypothetical protein